MNTRIKWLLSLSRQQKIVLGIFIVVLLFVFFRFRPVQSSDVQEYIVKRGDISETIVVSGNANATNNASVYSSTTGIVEDIYVENGSVVSEGQLLMKIKSTVSEIERANAYEDYLTARSLLNTAKQSKLENQSSLESGRKAVIDSSIALTQMIDRRNSGLSNPATGKPYTQNEIDSITSAAASSKTSFEALEQAYLTSDASIAVAQSSVNATWLSYQATMNGEIKAPTQGTVINLSVARGDAVKAKATTTVTTQVDVPVLRISSDSQTTIIVKMNETDIAKVRPGQSASVVFDALPEATFSATVARVDSVGENVNAVVTYNAYITLDEQDERILPTMTATVTIATEKKNGVLLVPNTSLSRDEGDVVVSVKRNGNVTKQEVRIGMKHETESEVLSGVSEGDIILVSK